MNYYVLYTSDMGTQTILFDSERDRQSWLNRMDDSVDDFYCLDVAGELEDAYVACMDCDPEDCGP